MKKILKTTLIILLVCILAVTVFCGGFALYILNCSSAIGSRLIVDEDNKTLSVNDDKDLRILQLSDTQITAYGDALKTLDIIKLTVDKANPDLIVLTGDNLMNDSKQSMLKNTYALWISLKSLGRPCLAITTTTSMQLWIGNVNFMKAVNIAYSKKERSKTLTATIITI